MTEKKMSPKKRKLLNQPTNLICDPSGSKLNQFNTVTSFCVHNLSQKEPHPMTMGHYPFV